MRPDRVDGERLAVWVRSGCRAYRALVACLWFLCSFVDPFHTRLFSFPIPAVGLSRESFFPKGTYTLLRNAARSAIRQASFFFLLPFFPYRFLRLILSSKLGTVIPSRRLLRLWLADGSTWQGGQRPPLHPPEAGRPDRPHCRRGRLAAPTSRPFIDLRLDAVAGEVAVCEPRPPLPPLPGDLALLAEGAWLAPGEASALDRTQGDENMGVDVFSVAVPVRGVNGPVREEALAGEVLMHEVADEKDLLRGRQFVGQGQFEAMGELRVFGAGALALDKLQTVPDLGPDRRPRRGVFRGPDLRVKDARLAAVVVALFRSLVGQGIAGTIGRRRDDATDV